MRSAVPEASSALLGILLPANFPVEKTPMWETNLLRFIFIKVESKYLLLVIEQPNRRQTNVCILTQTLKLPLSSQRQVRPSMNMLVLIW